MRKQSDYELKIHLRLNENNDPACNAKPTFNHKYVTEDHSKVNCARCKKIVNAIKNSKTRLATLN